MTRLAIIPARAGSKRIPDKNIRDFFGRPIIAYSLEAARHSGLFGEIHVSTDSERIRDVVETLGYPAAFARPSELADDHAPLRDVLRYVRDRYAALGRRFDCICRLSACAPLIEAADLVAAERLFAAHEGKHAVTAVTRFPAPLDRAFALDESGLLRPLRDDRLFERSQDLDTAYYDSGTFALLAPTHLDLEGPAFYQNRLGYVLPRAKGVDIDEPEDWAFAEEIFAGRRRLPASR